MSKPRFEIRNPKPEIRIKSETRVSEGIPVRHSPLWFLVSGLMSFLLCARAFAQTAPSQGQELLQSKAAMPGYGAEVYRIVSQPDEIISVLRNGAVVICKHVSSPVAAVRGYAETGGVYEGQWLGGGLSHLLEHLVAGGSSERRTETQNKQLLQVIGNDSNAYTTYDHTAFFVNTTTPHFEQAVDLVTGWMLVQRSRFRNIGANTRSCNGNWSATRAIPTWSSGTSCKARATW